MQASTHLVAALALAVAPWAATAQTPADHEQHHPGAAAPASPSSTAAPEQAVAAMERHLQRMREASRRLADARTPQERQALMNERRRLMQEGLQLMGPMRAMPQAAMGAAGGAGMPDGMGPQMMGAMMERHAWMDKRMEMVQSVLQMLLEPIDAPAAK